MNSGRVIALMAGAGLTAMTACGTTATPTNAPPISTTPGSSPTAITLTEMNVAMPISFKAGKYTFKNTNSGTVPHELLVFSSSLTPDNYPTDADGRINEEGKGVTLLSDGDNLAPGESQTRVVDLSTPGNYLFVCNLPGHFAAHMYTIVTVTA